jgi:hypothetical protein
MDKRGLGGLDVESLLAEAMGELADLVKSEACDAVRKWVGI